MIQTLGTSSMMFYVFILTVWLANKPKTFNKKVLTVNKITTTYLLWLALTVLKAPYTSFIF